jgi:PAS domain S-box-containing protein
MSDRTVSGAKILVVEDDSFTRRLLESMFSALGHSILTASNGAEGLDVFRKERPALVISDYNMPVMNGLEMMDVIRKEAPSVKIVLMTMYTEPQVLIDAINLGVDRFLEKPVFKDRLEKVLSVILEDIRIASELEKYQNLLKAYRLGVDSSTIFSILDVRGNFTYVNENLCTISEYSEKDLLGNHYSMVRKTHEINDIRYVNISDKTADRVWQGCVVNISKSGHEYVTEASLFPVFEFGRLSGFISIEKDMSFVVSHHKSQLQIFFDADSSILFAFTTDMKLSMCNKAFCRFFGYKSAVDAAGCGFDLSDFTEDCADMSELTAMTAGNAVKKMTVRNPQDDTEHYFTISGFELEQRYLGLDNLKIFRLNDITELENLKNDELSRVMLASIGKLSAGITHEINTPLTYIKGNIELLEWELDDIIPEEKTGDIRDYFVSVNDGISRITAIIQSMREVTGEAVFDMDEINLYTTLVVAGRMVYNRSKHISAVFINGRPLNLETNPDAEVYMYHGAAKMLEQVWIILLNNSLDQLAQSDLLFDRKFININISTGDDGRHVIRFCDNGGGIDPKILGRMFDLFTSTKKHKGMGIGLNIAKRIIDKHNGTIRPSNHENGAVFEIIL